MIKQTPIKQTGTLNPLIFTYLHLHLYIKNLLTH